MASLPRPAAFLSFFFLVLATVSVPPSSSEYSEGTPSRHDGEFPIAVLWNGVSLPQVGLGCASGVRKKHIVSALRAGYRLLDTAQSYQWGYHEDEVGEALVASGVDREEVFVQTKIHPEDLGFDATKRAASVSLERLVIDKIDSILIHKPRCWEGACQKDPEGTWEESWVALEELYDEGIVDAIGICDVTASLLQRLLKQRIKPHIIQNWMDPFHQDKHIRQRCKEEGIQYQAYSTLGSQWSHHRGHKVNPVLNDPTLLSIAKAHGVDVARVVINWATRHGVAVVPASTNEGRQRTNLDSFSFDLTHEEMKAIDALDGTLKPPTLDPNKVSVAFENLGGFKVHSFWISNESEEVPVGEIGAGDALSLTSFHGHRFVFKDEGGTVIGEHTITREGGKMQKHIIAHNEL